MGKKRRRFSAVEKVSILKRHLVEKQDVTAICEELKLHPNQFYDWQRQFFEHGVKAFEKDEKRAELQLKDRVASLEAKLQRKDSVLSELMEEHVALKKSWGSLKARWVEPDLRDRVVDFVHHWVEREFSKVWLITKLEIRMSKFYSWHNRYGKDNDHNGKIPRDYWVQDWEKQKIIKYYLDHKIDSYRRVTYMMLDQDIVAVSPATTYRILSNAGLLKRWNEAKPSLKGTGFVQPLKPHEHWHVDISYLNICGTFYYFIGILDGCSRFIVHWDIRKSMTEDDVALVIERAREKFPGVKPRIISDNGPQFIAKDFKEYVRLSGMTHVRTSPYYPQSNGKLERFNRTMKSECIRPKTPVSLDDALRLVAEFIEYYNSTRLHSAIGYIAPLDKLWGREQKIFDARDRKLETARALRKQKRELQIATAGTKNNCSVTNLTDRS